jgi:hypothetical protein
MAPDLSGPKPNTPARMRVGEHRGDAEEGREPQLAAGPCPGISGVDRRVRTGQ